MLNTNGNLKGFSESLTLKTKDYVCELSHRFKIPINGFINDLPTGFSNIGKESDHSLEIQSILTEAHNGIRSGWFFFFSYMDQRNQLRKLNDENLKLKRILNSISNEVEPVNL